MICRREVGAVAIGRAGGFIVAAEDPIELVLNPGVSLSLQCTVRRKDRPAVRFGLTGANRELVRWLLGMVDRDPADGAASAGDELSERVLRTALDAGVLVRRDEVPDPAVPYRCGPEPAILELVPPEAMAAARAADPADLRLTARCVVQRGPALPDELRERIRRGSDLWAHLGKDFTPAGPTSFADGASLLWVEQPASSVIEPIWVCDDLAEEICAVVAARRTVASLSAPARELLVLTNAARSGPPVQDRAAEWGDLPGARFAVIRDVVSALTRAALRRHFRALRSAGNFELDVDQVVGMRDGMYSELVCLYLQHQLTHALDRVLHEPVRGSYTWVRRYHPGAVLARHTDRPQCRWNVSLCVDHRPDHDAAPWPIYLEVDGQVHEVQLGLGDAVVYSGTDVPHWRDALPAGREVTMCFFHYVPVSFTGSLR